MNLARPAVGSLTTCRSGCRSDPVNSCRQYPLVPERYRKSRDKRGQSRLFGVSRTVANVRHGVEFGRSAASHETQRRTSIVDSSDRIELKLVALPKTFWLA